MSIIIDANRSGDFSTPLSHHAAEILTRVTARRLRVSVGGHLLQELMKTRLRDILVEWQRAGLLDRSSDATVQAETKRFQTIGLSSDDPHVMALAHVSGCRLLYTADANLIADFKERAFLVPRGKIVSPGTSGRVACALFDRFAK